MQTFIIRVGLFALASASVALPACARSSAPAEDKAKDEAKDEAKDSDKGKKADDSRFDKVQIETVKITDNVFMLIGAGGNIGVSAGPDGILIIDDQFAPLVPKIKAALDALPVAGKGPLRYVLNTHYHGDHMGGNAALSGEAAIAAHDNVRNRLVGEGKPPEALPQITFDDTMTVHFNGDAIRAVHFARGHTDGDSVVFFDKADVVHMGDHFFNGKFPFVDMDAGGDPIGYANNVAAVIEKAKPTTKIIPGHGPLASVDDLRAFHAMMTETTAAVRAQVEAGKSLEAIQKAGLDPKWKDWGTGFIKTDRWIATLHRALTASK